MTVPAPLLRVAAIRRGLRRLRKFLSIRAYQLRTLLGRRLPSRVVTSPSTSPPPVLLDPVVLVLDDGAEDSRELELALAKQTETSWTRDLDHGSRATFLFVADSNFSELPETHLEGMVMALAGETLCYATGGWAEFSSQEPQARASNCLLTRRPPEDPSVVGRILPHWTSNASDCDRAKLVPGVLAAGPYLLREDRPTGRLYRSEIQSIHTSLQALPAIDGPPTVLFVLPYLAVGGAERLLLQLLQGLHPTYRCLVVTLEPHVATRGQTLDEARQLTPHVYPLGDWLPRECRMSALRHLLRRYRVQTLFGWNGATDLYDQWGELRREFPRLRLVNQLFNHEGGWMEHYSPLLASSVDCHVAINSRISQALANRWRIPSNRIAEVPHAIELPAEVGDSELAEKRRLRRRELGIPVEALVVGSFIRLHPQKRPLDILALTRRLESDGVHCLLVGGGPLEAEIDAELMRTPLSNLTRLPMQADPSPLFDAIDLCLLTSEYEGLPLFLLEGLSRGIPAVAPAVGDIPQLLESGGGTVIERPGDIDGLVDAIRGFREGERRRNAGRLGRERVRSEHSLPQYISRYRRVIFPESTS